MSTSSQLRVTQFCFFYMFYLLVFPLIKSPPSCSQTTLPASYLASHGAPVRGPSAWCWWCLMVVSLHSAALPRCPSACVCVRRAAAWARCAGSRPSCLRRASAWGRLWPSCCACSFCYVSMETYPNTLNIDYRF